MWYVQESNLLGFSAVDYESSVSPLDIRTTLPIDLQNNFQKSIHGIILDLRLTSIITPIFSQVGDKSEA